MSSASNHHHDPLENQPLLNKPQDKTDEDHKANLPESAASFTPPRIPSWLRLPVFETIHPRYRYIPLLGCLVILLNEAEYCLKQAATMRAIESLLCIEYYEVHDPELALRLGRGIPESLCKADEIEKRVATTSAAILLYRMLSATIAALPLGRLADEGRWRVLVLHKLGIVLSSLWLIIAYVAYPALPISSIPFGGLAALFGGNFDLGIAVLFACYSDVLKNPVQRSSLFFLTTGMQYIAQLICPPIGGLLMNLDGKGGTPLLAISLASICGVMCLILVLFLFPETLQKKDPAHNQEPNTVNEATPTPQPGFWKAICAKAAIWRVGVQEGLEGLGLVNTSSLALSMFLVSIGIKAIDWFGLLQYPVIRLGWSYSQASNIPSFQAIITVILFFLILPFATHRLSALTTLSLSLCVLIAGSVLLGLSTTIPFFLLSMALYTLGEGFNVTAQSYIASRLAPQHLARVLAVLSVAATAGKVGASGAWPPLLGLGLDVARRGAEWGKGLPMFAFAGMFVVAGAGVGIVACRTRRDGNGL